MTNSLKPYEVIAAKKRAEQQSKIPDEWRIPAQFMPDDKTTNLTGIPLACGILNDVEVQITSDYDATGLLAELKRGTFSVEQVTTAFCKRAAIAHQLTNCLTEILFKSALVRAKYLDHQRTTDPSSPLPPLFGLPISLKDTFAIANTDTASPVASLAFHPSTENAALVNLLLDLGAVLYCKTNVPQSVLTGDTENHVFGRTLNPLNTKLTVGGSTGGEAALLALRGSVLGVGTDIAGSIRVPSVCCGLYGLRASVGLVPHGGVTDLNPDGMGSVMGGGIRSTAGPLASSLRDVRMFMEAVMGVGGRWRYDCTAMGVNWVENGGRDDGDTAREGMGERKWKMRIGVARDDGVFTPTPPVRRGLQLAIDRLIEDAEHGVELVEIGLPGVMDIYQDVLRYVMLCGGEHYTKLFAQTGEPPIQSLGKTGLLSLSPVSSLQAFFDLNTCRAKAAEVYLNLFREHDLDAILMPAAPHTALPLDSWVRAAYTCLWNYLDYPALVIPVDKVRDEDVVDKKGLRENGYGGADGDLYKLYTGPEDYKDAPVCVQLVGYRQRDEALLEAATILDAIINKSS